MDNKYDIIILGGQSNAEGFGVGNVIDEYQPNENILWLNDNAKPHFVKNEQKGKDELKLDYPSEPYISVAKEPLNENGQVTGKLSFIFAKNYYEKYLKGTDRKVLIINSAVGGTGFARNEWGYKNAILYTRLCNMTSYALNLNKENKIVAFLWHQGECDSFENADWSLEKKYQTHKYNLSTMLSDFEEKFNVNNLPMITASFCDEWYLKNKVPCDAVLKAMKEVFSGKNRAFVDASNLPSNNQDSGNGDDIHFCRQSAYILGQKYFDKFEIIKG